MRTLFLPGDRPVPVATRPRAAPAGTPASKGGIQICTTIFLDGLRCRFDNEISGYFHQL